MDIDIIFTSIGMFFLISFISSWKEKNQINAMIEDHSYSNSKLVSPKRWMKKRLDITKQFIHKYPYYKTYLFITYASLGPVNTLIFLFSGCKKEVGGILFFMHCCLGIFDTLTDCIYTIIYKICYKNK